MFLFDLKVKTPEIINDPNLIQVSYNGQVVNTILKNRGIDTSLYNIDPNKTYTGEELGTILGNDLFKQFQGWYITDYLKNLRDSTGSFTHGSGKSISVTAAMAETRHKEKESYEKRLHEITENEKKKNFPPPT